MNVFLTCSAAIFFAFGVSMLAIALWVIDIDARRCVVGNNIAMHCIVGTIDAVCCIVGN